MTKNIPSEVSHIASLLTKAGFKVYLVGGCVRDLLLGHEPKDWDITTDAKPADIQKLFPDSVYENDFGTVAVKTDSELSRLKIVEVTTFRKEAGYSDRRHPDSITFADSITTDLARRDFTVNAMAVPFQNEDFSFSDLVDPYGGLTDLKSKLIRAVGNPHERFNEDALRLLRAVRLAAELDFSIARATLSALLEKVSLLKDIAPERIRDEFIKIISSPRASIGIRLLANTKLLSQFIPELSAGIDCSQNKHHIFDVFEHSVRALEYAAKQQFNLAVRLAALFHDIGKPPTKQGEGENSTFYNHEVVGTTLVRDILARLCFPKRIASRVAHLVRYHMFNYNVDEVSPAGVRRFIARVGLDAIDDLLNLREADRIGSGVPKAFPYKLRHLLYMIDKVRRDPISPQMLKINGDELITNLKLKPSPRIGLILHALLEDVLDDPTHNTSEYLGERAKDLNQLTDEQLALLAEQAKQKQSALEAEADQNMKNRYHVS